MKIQVLGTGCPKCRETLERVERAVNDSGVDATIEKVEGVAEIMSFGVVATPAIAIDGVVRFSGRLPDHEEIVALVASHADPSS